MKRTFLKSGILALALAAAAVFAVGVSARDASANSPLVNPGGPYGGVAGAPIQFGATSNVGPVSSVYWQFGDGTSQYGMTVFKTFHVPGIFGVAVTVTNVYGQSFTSQTTASIARVTGTHLDQRISRSSGFTIVRRVDSEPAVVNPVGTTTLFGLGSCAYGVTLVNGHQFSCAATTSMIERLLVFNPACFQLWVQSGVMPSCALAYR